MNDDTLMESRNRHDLAATFAVDGAHPASDHHALASAATEGQALPA